MEEDPFEKWISGMFAPKTEHRETFFDRFAERLVSIASLQPSAMILDVATGQGSILKQVAKVVGPNGTLIGIDIDSSVLEKTFKNLKKYSQIQLYCMDAHALDFNDNWFDIVFCGFGVYTFDDPDRAVKEMFRVLKPEGKVYISIWAVELLEKSSQKFVASLLSKAGFIEVEVIHDKIDFVYPTFNDWYDSPTLQMGKAELETLKPQEISSVKKTIKEIYGPYIKSDGLHQPLNVQYFHASKPPHQ